MGGESCSGLKFMSFSSGSCGNCYLLGNENSFILIDAGISLRRLKKTLNENRIPIASACGILVTHDHLDHIRHLGQYCKYLQLPVFTTEVLHDALSKHSVTSRTIGSCRRIIPIGEESVIGGFRVHPFIVPHDATQTVGFAIETESHKFVIMTDVGRMTDEAAAFASKADTVVVESNYDVDMLMGGRYTYDLKMRIMQGNGHLSNDECASAIKRFWHPGLRNIFLCHLSENNNTVQLAYNASADALDAIGVKRGSTALRCLPRTYPSPLFIL